MNLILRISNNRKHIKENRISSKMVLLRITGVLIITVLVLISQTFAAEINEKLSIGGVMRGTHQYYAGLETEIDPVLKRPLKRNRDPGYTSWLLVATIPKDQVRR